MARRPLSALRRARRSPLVPSARDLASFAATILFIAACVTWMPVPAPAEPVVSAARLGGVAMPLGFHGR